MHRTWPHDRIFTYYFQNFFYFFLLYNKDLGEKLIKETFIVKINGFKSELKWEISSTRRNKIAK